MMSDEILKEILKELKTIRLVSEINENRIKEDRKFRHDQDDVIHKFYAEKRGIVDERRDTDTDS